MKKKIFVKKAALKNSHDNLEVTALNVKFDSELWESRVLMQNSGRLYL